MLLCIIAYLSVLEALLRAFEVLERRAQLLFARAVRLVNGAQLRPFTLHRVVHELLLIPSALRLEQNT